MNEVINIALSPVNIVLTILVILLILYWLFTMISGVDFDLDIDVDVDVDVETELNFNTNSNIDGGNVDFVDIANTEVNKEDIIENRRKALKWWQIILIFFNFVGLPFMFTFTCWIFIWWISNLLSTSITGSYNNSLGYILFIAGIIPSLFLTKFLTTPFKSFFKNLNQDGDNPIDITGRTGVLFSTILEDKMGSAQVLAEGVPMSIYVKSLGGEKLEYKQKILVIKQSDDKNFYFVKEYNN